SQSRGLVRVVRVSARLAGDAGNAPARRLGEPGVAAACAARARRARPHRGTVRERRFTPLRSGGGLVGAEDDARSGLRSQAVRRLRTDEPATAGSADLGIPLARKSPDARPAARDGRPVRAREALIEL